MRRIFVLILSAVVPPAMVSAQSTGTPIFINVPPDPFPSQEFFDANSGIFVNVLGDVQFDEAMSFDFNRASINVEGSFNNSLLSGQMVYSNSSWRINGDVGSDSTSTLFTDSLVAMLGGTLQNPSFSADSIVQIVGGEARGEMQFVGETEVFMLGGSMSSETTIRYADTSFLFAVGGGIDSPQLRGSEDATAFILADVMMNVEEISGFADLRITGGFWNQSAGRSASTLFSGQSVQFFAVDFLVNGSSLDLAIGETFTFDGSFFSEFDDVVVNLQNGESLRPRFGTGHFTFTAVPAPGGAIVMLASFVLARRRR